MRVQNLNTIIFCDKGVGKNDVVERDDYIDECAMWKRETLKYLTIMRNGDGNDL